MVILVMEVEVDFDGIVTAVSGLIQDSSYVSDTIMDRVNETLIEVSHKVLIPELKTIAAVSTEEGVAYVSLAEITGGFSGSIRRVRRSGEADNLSIYPTLELFMDEYEDMDEAGDVEAVCLEGMTLWYQKIPEEVQDIILLYYKNPDVLEDDSDVPSFVPAFLHRKLFVNGTAWKILDEIEEGIEGEKINAARQKVLFDEGLNELLNWIGRNRRHYVSSYWDV